MIKETVLHDSKELKFSKCTESLADFTDYFTIFPKPSNSNQPEKITVIKFNSISQSILALNSNNSLNLLNIGKNKVNLISKNSSIVDFDFLDSSNSYFILLFSNGEITLIGRNAKTVQIIHKNEMKICEKLKVSLKLKYFLFFSKKTIQFFFQKNGGKKYTIFQTLNSIGQNEFINIELTSDQSHCCVLQKQNEFSIYNVKSQNRVYSIQLNYSFDQISCFPDDFIVLSGFSEVFQVINSNIYLEEKTDTFDKNSTVLFTLPLNNNSVIKSRIMSVNIPQIAFLCADKTVYSIELNNDIFKIDHKESVPLKSSNLFKFKNNQIKDFEISDNQNYSAVIFQNGGIKIFETKILGQQKLPEIYKVFAIEESEQILNELNKDEDDVTHEQYNPFQKNFSSEEQTKMQKIKKYIRNYYKFPDSERRNLWTFILAISEKPQAFENLKSMNRFSKEPLCITLKEAYLNSEFQILCDCFAHFCPFFYNNKLFMSFVYPFLKLFSPDLFFVFEVSLKFMFNWGQLLFTNYPNNSVKVQKELDVVFEYFSPGISQHFGDIQFYDVIFSFFASIYANVLPRENCVVIFDVLIAFSGAPELFYLFAVSIILLNQEKVLKIKTASQIPDLIFEISKTDVVEIVNFTFEIFEICCTQKIFDLKFQDKFQRMSDFYYGKFPFLPKLQNGDEMRL